MCIATPDHGKTISKCCAGSCFHASLEDALLDSIDQDHYEYSWLFYLQESALDRCGQYADLIQKTYLRRFDHRVQNAMLIQRAALRWLYLPNGPMSRLGAREMRSALDGRMIM